jgi:hypothetical protein
MPCLKTLFLRHTPKFFPRFRKWTPNGNNEKKIKAIRKNLKVHSLPPCNNKRRACGSSKMGINNTWYIHDHLVDKSHAQAKQCKSLVENGTIFRSQNLLQTHMTLTRKKGHNPPSYNILRASHKGYIQMTFFFKIYVVLNV